MSLISARRRSRSPRAGVPLVAFGLVEELTESDVEPVEPLLQLCQPLEEREGILPTEGGYPGCEHDD